MKKTLVIIAIAVAASVAAVFFWLHHRALSRAGGQLTGSDVIAGTQGGPTAYGDQPVTLSQNDQTFLSQGFSMHVETGG